MVIQHSELGSHFSSMNLNQNPRPNRCIISSCVSFFNDPNGLTLNTIYEQKVRKHLNIVLKN